MLHQYTRLFKDEDLSGRFRVQPSAKHFAEHLNKTLDDLGMPANTRERASILSKMLHIPKQQAWSLVEGQVLPDDDLLQIMATELEVSADWLIGKAH